MKSVTKAVIPAAGWGTRFLPASKAVPKEMFPLVDKPVIQYIVEEAAEAGIRDIYIVTGKGKAAINRHFGRNRELEKRLREDGKSDLLDLIKHLGHAANVHFITQPEAKGLGHAVWCAAPFVGDEPFAVLLGDMVAGTPEAGIRPLLDVYRDQQSTVLAVSPVAWSETGNYGIVDGVLESERLIKVNRLVEKPQDLPPSNYAIMGRYVLDPAVFPLLGNQTPGAGGEIQLTDALQQLVNAQPVYAHIAEDKIYDVGHKLGYLQAAVRQALRQPDLKDALLAYLGQIPDAGKHGAIRSDRRDNG